MCSKIVVPEIGTTVRSDPADYRGIERQSAGTVLSGMLVGSHVYPKEFQTVNFCEDLPHGSYAVIDALGKPFALASVTYAEGNPAGNQYPLWWQFNPFEYPVYARLWNSQCSPKMQTLVFSVSKRLSAGKFGLTPLPFRKSNPVREVIVREMDTFFGMPQSIKFR
jgi:hypothetical protein